MLAVVELGAVFRLLNIVHVGCNHPHPSPLPEGEVAIF